MAIYPSSRLSAQQGTPDNVPWLMGNPPERRMDIGDLFANIIGHCFMAYIIIQLAQGLPYAFICIQPPGTRVRLVIPDEVAFEGHE